MGKLLQGSIEERVMGAGRVGGLTCIRILSLLLLAPHFASALTIPLRCRLIQRGLTPARSSSVVAAASDVVGYFEFRELELVHRDPQAVAQYEQRECERWRAVYDEEWPATPQELYEGDRMEVVRDVRVKGIENARGMQGIVSDVWMECETDAACCCNELATAPVTVNLERAA